MCISANRLTQMMPSKYGDTYSLKSLYKDIEFANRETQIVGFVIFIT